MKGIRVSHRVSRNSSFDDVRVEADLPGKPETLVSLLLDVEGYPRWAFASDHSYSVSGEHRTGMVYYSQISVPWPAADRHLYAQIKVFPDSANRVINVQCNGLPKYGPVKRGFVRIPFSTGIWKITAPTDNTIHVDYILEANPGGNVPAWIMNLFAAKGPYETFIHLQRILSQKKEIVR